MVNGLDRFKKHFTTFADRYVLIGGTASSLSVEELGGEFRVTKDLDIVLCVEALDREFAEAFWAFVNQGRYENRQKSTGKRLFYRFYDPQEKGFPDVADPPDLKSLGITSMTLPEVLDNLRRIYNPSESPDSVS